MENYLLRLLKKRKREGEEFSSNLIKQTITPTETAKDFNDWCEYVHNSYWATKNYGGKKIKSFEHESF